jgi:hypothetical protein
MSVIPVLRRLKQEGHKFTTSLGYIVIPCLKKKENKAATNHLSDKGLLFRVCKELIAQ